MWWEWASKPCDPKIWKLTHDSDMSLLPWLPPWSNLMRRTRFHSTVVVVRPGLYLASETLSQSTLITEYYVYCTTSMSAGGLVLNEKDLSNTTQANTQPACMFQRNCQSSPLVLCNCCGHLIGTQMLERMSRWPHFWKCTKNKDTQIYFTTAFLSSTVPPCSVVF